MNKKKVEELREEFCAGTQSIVSLANKVLPKEKAIVFLEKIHTEFGRQIDLLRKKKIRKNAPIHYRSHCESSVGACHRWLDADNATTNKNKVTCKECLRMLAKGKV